MLKGQEDIRWISASRTCLFGDMSPNHVPGPETEALTYGRLDDLDIREVWLVNLKHRKCVISFWTLTI